MKSDLIEEVLDSEFNDGSGRTFREFLSDCLILLFKESESFSGKCAASDTLWSHTVCECLLPLDGKIGHYEDYNENEKEFVLDDFKAAKRAFTMVINRTLGTMRRG